MRRRQTLPLPVKRSTAADPLSPLSDGYSTSGLKVWFGAFGVAFGWLLLVPEPAYAWGPATHVALGEMVLGALYLLPPAARALLERYPLHFLYGSIAADISFAKKYVPEGRHCHNWHVGEEILADAAIEIAKSCPFLDTEGSIDVSEIREMPQ